MRFLLSAFVACCAFAQNPLVFENKLVRVVKAANIPTQKSRPHVHLVNRVMVHLDKGTMQIVNMETGPKDIPFTAGQVRWDPKVGLHTSENIGGTAFRIIEIEMKNEPPTLTKLARVPKSAKLDSENPQVRVLRVPVKARSASKEVSYGAPQVVVRLSDGHTEWREKGKQSYRNDSDAAVEFVIVEVK
ncbi:MAG: hypothetical protein FJW38_29695 [Acidobacteria bacterium]|nr:hypothetical protein [Acidobacteriota bacterium]